jgi:hypothetical protein
VLSQVVLLILAVVWAVFLVPQVLRARAARSGDSVGAFSQQLSILGRTNPASGGALGPMPVVPGPDDDDLGERRLTLAEARQRRKDVLRWLLIAMGATLVLGLLPFLRRLWMLHLLLDVAFVAYVGLLYRAQTLSAGHRAGRHQLPDEVEVEAEEQDGDGTEDDTGDVRILEHSSS